MKQNSHHPGSPSAAPRITDLLADRAVFGLDADEEQELATLLKTMPDTDHESLDRIAAALAVQWLNPQANATPRPPRAADKHRPFLFAVTALAASLIAIAAWPIFTRRPEPPAGLPPVADTFVRARDEMLRSLDDVVHLECNAILAANEVVSPRERARGDIVWSPSRQRGFLRIRGLPANDPREKQYQIWIIAGRRTVPLRCGVFDVRPPGGTEISEPNIVVPILPPEFVQGPMTFAITVEQPGGADHYAPERARAMAQVD